MKILVIGGGGFLGSELVSDLAKVRSNQIQVIDSFSHGFPKATRKKKNIEPPVCANINNFRDILRVMERFRPEVVYHLAAFNSRPEAYGDFRTCAEVNYLGTANVVHAITSLSQKPKQLIFSSSLAAEDPVSHFGISKKAAEDLILTTLGRFTDYDVRVNILRFAEIYGPSPVFTSTSMANFLVDNMLRGYDLAMYGVKESIDCLHITDAVKACKLVLSNSCEEKILDIGTGVGVPIIDLIEKVRGLTNYTGRMRYLDHEKVPIRTYVANVEPAKAAIGFVASAGLDEYLADLVKKRRKVIR